MIRRAKGRATSVLAALLLAPGCRAYDARLWSFPLNSMQMVDDAVADGRSFGKALALELAFHLFPWTWIVSAVDILMLPITLPYDLVELTIRRDAPFPFDEQVLARKRQGVQKPAPTSPDRVTRDVGPRVRNQRATERLEPAEH